MEASVGEDRDGGDPEAGWLNLQSGVELVDEVDEGLGGAIKWFGDVAAALGLVDAVEEDDPVTGRSGAYTDRDEFAIGRGKRATEIEIRLVDGDRSLAGAMQKDRIIGRGDLDGGSGLSLWVSVVVNRPVIVFGAQAEQLPRVRELGVDGAEEDGGGEEEERQFHRRGS